MTGQEEWDSVDDFSVDSLRAEVSSTSTVQSTFTPSSPPEEINGEELPSDCDVPKNSSTELLQKMGHWFYNTRLVQYMKSDERSRVKQIYSTNSIWMLGIEYKFPEDCGSVNLPKLDNEKARSSRASSFLNLVFGSSEEDNDYDDTSTQDRHQNDDSIQSHKLGKSRSFSQAAYNVDGQHLAIPHSKVTPRIAPNSSLTGPNIVIQRLRSLSFSQKSPPPETKSFPDSLRSNTENRVNSGSSNPVYHRQGGRRLNSFSFNKKSDSLDISQMDSKSSSIIQTDNSMISPPNTPNNQLQAPNPKRSSIIAPNFLRNFSNSNQGVEPSNSTTQGVISSKSKKPRRMTFAGIFSGKEKNKLGNSSRKLYPHVELEGDLDSKFSGNESRLKYESLENIDNSRNQIPEVLYTEDVIYSSGESDGGDFNSRIEEVEPEALSGDNVSVETVTRESVSHKDIKYFDLNNNNVKGASDDNMRSRQDDLQANTDVLHKRKISDAGSVRSTSSFQSISTPTSLYKPDSLGSLSPNQKKLMDFYLDFQSRIFCCYRKDFLPIEPAFHTTDTGWGCMHRTGQSLLAQGFLWSLLGRDWRLHNDQKESDKFIYRKILRWFMDGPEPEQYYSIHNIARTGIALDKKIGDWFGPATVAHVLKRLSLNHKECPLTIHIPADNTIYRTEVIDLFNEQKERKPILILLSVRLGTDRFNPCYFGNLKTLFTFPQFLGIAGGRPRKSLYFVAVQDDELLYLDPHFVRPAINLNRTTEFPIEDYHSTIVRTMDISEMDPSMLLGFLCQRPQDFDDLCERAEQTMNLQFPIFTMLNISPVRETWLSTKSVSEMPNTLVDAEVFHDDSVDDLKEIIMDEDDAIVGEENYELL
ncbi:peptidase C54 [Gigaspora margarita]|nr:peptidase C54 [Gigaspora margarita]